MPNRNYDNGTDLERAWVDDMRDAGWVAARTPGSKGPFDGFAAKGGELILMQAKYGGTYDMDGFGPEARRTLREVARCAGGRGLLVRKRKRERGYREIAEDQWPD